MAFSFHGGHLEAFKRHFTHSALFSCETLAPQSSPRDLAYMSRLSTKPVHFRLCLHKCFDETVLHGGAGAIRHRIALLGP